MQDVTDQVQVHLDVAAAVENQHSRNISLKRKLLIAKKIPFVFDIEIYLLFGVLVQFIFKESILYQGLDLSRTPLSGRGVFEQNIGTPFLCFAAEFCLS